MQIFQPLAAEGGAELVVDDVAPLPAAVDIARSVIYLDGSGVGGNLVVIAIPKYRPEPREKEPKDADLFEEELVGSGV